MRRIIVNLALYEAGWVAAITCAAHASPGWAAAAPLGLTALHVALARRPWNELLLVAVAGAFGCAVDSLLIAIGAFAPQSPGVLAWLPPLWLTALWVQLATLLRFSLRWLAGRYWLAALLGAAGGPVAFLAGVNMGAATFPNGPGFAIALLAASWALATPILFGISTALNRGDQTGAYRFER